MILPREAKAVEYSEALTAIRALVAGAPRDAAAPQVVEFLHRRFPHYSWVGIYWVDGSDLHGRA